VAADLGKKHGLREHKRPVNVIVTRCRRRRLVALDAEQHFVLSQEQLMQKTNPCAGTWRAASFTKDVIIQFRLIYGRSRNRIHGFRLSSGAQRQLNSKRAQSIPDWIAFITGDRELSRSIVANAGSTGTSQVAVVRS